MSSVVVPTSAALGRHFIFDEESEPEVGSVSTIDRTAEGGRPHISSITQVLQSAINNQKLAIPLAPASRLEVRPAPEMVSSGIADLDALTGGLPRGCVIEICGPVSSGRTALLLSALAAATRRGEFCAVVDANDALDPQSVAAAGVELDRLLWVRCGENTSSTNRSPQRHRDTEKTQFKNPLRNTNPSEHRLEQVLRATDLLLESGGFGMIVLDLADLQPQDARRIPLTTWFRFRRAIEHTPTILLAIEQQAIAGSCSSLLLQLGSPATSGRGSDAPSHTNLLTELNITAEVIRSQLRSHLERKPMRSVKFASKTAWAG